MRPPVFAPLPAGCRGWEGRQGASLNRKLGGAAVLAGAARLLDHSQSSQRPHVADLHGRLPGWHGRRRNILRWGGVYTLAALALRWSKLDVVGARRRRVLAATDGTAADAEPCRVPPAPVSVSYLEGLVVSSPPSKHGGAMTHAHVRADLHVDNCTADARIHACTPRAHVYTRAHTRMHTSHTRIHRTHA